MVAGSENLTKNRLLNKMADAINDSGVITTAAGDFLFVFDLSAGLVGKVALSSLTLTDLGAIVADVVVGSDGTGYDVTFFGDTSAYKWMFDQSADQVVQTAGQVTNYIATTDATTYTVLAKNSGHVHAVPNLTASCTITLPTPAAGLNYKFVYAGVAADAQDWVFTTGADVNYFIGGLAFLDTDGNEVNSIAGDGNSNSKLTVVKPDVGTEVNFYSNGTLWLLSGYVNSITVPAFADQ